MRPQTDAAWKFRVRVAGHWQAGSMPVPRPAPTRTSSPRRPAPALAPGGRGGRRARHSRALPATRSQRRCRRTLERKLATGSAGAAARTECQWLRRRPGLPRAQASGRTHWQAQLEIHRGRRVVLPVAAATVPSGLVQVSAAAARCVWCMCVWLLLLSCQPEPECTASGHPGRAVRSRTTAGPGAASGQL